MTVPLNVLKFGKSRQDLCPQLIGVLWVMWATNELDSVLAVTDRQPPSGFGHSFVAESRILSGKARSFSLCKVRRVNP